MTKLDPQFRKALQEFLSSPIRNQWIMTPQMEVYVRKGGHMLNQHMYMFLDLANITVYEQSQGIFKQTLEVFKELSSPSLQGVYIENVLNPQLAEYLRRLAATEPASHWSEETRCFAWLAEQA